MKNIVENYRGFEIKKNVTGNFLPLGVPDFERGSRILIRIKNNSYYVNLKDSHREVLDAENLEEIKVKIDQFLENLKISTIENKND
jgi:hypothetical protein